MSASPLIVRTGMDWLENTTCVKIPPSPTAIPLAIAVRVSAADWFQCVTTSSPASLKYPSSCAIANWAPSCGSRTPATSTVRVSRPVAARDGVAMAASAGASRAAPAACMLRRRPIVVTDISDSLGGNAATQSSCHVAATNKEACPQAKWPEFAARARRARAGSEVTPVRSMMDARWFSTVRWLMPRSAAMFLLGYPATTRRMISR